MKKIRPTAKNRPYRHRKKIILIGAEGKNKTEQLYFRELARTQDVYHVVFSKGNETDPMNIVKKTADTVGKEDLQFESGDLAFAVFDLDNDRSKADPLSKAKAIAAHNDIMVVTSNPCFEVWYRLHFGYTSRPYRDGQEVIRDVKNHIPDYEKNSCDFGTLYPRTEDAIANCKQLKQHHERTGEKNIPEFANPLTDVYKIVEILIKEGQYE